MGSLFSRVIQGDHEAFKEWMDLYIRNIERFAVQYGVTLHDAGKVTEAVFREMYEKIGQLTEEQLQERNLFQNAVDELSGLKLVFSSKGLFPFEEDNELHAQLIELPTEERIALILFNFHEKSQIEIAWIMDTSIENVEDLLAKARMKLDRTDLEKRLELLNKSFHRLRPSYNERNIFHSTQKEMSRREPAKEANWWRKPVFLWLVGTVMLVLILSVTVLRSDAYQQSSAERFIEDLKVSFQQELDERFEIIGLAEPDEYEAETYIYYPNGMQIKQEVYGKEIKWEFNRFVQDLEWRLNEEGKINKKGANKRFDNLIHKLRLPSEMLGHLRKNPLANDREKSMEFLNEFSIKNSYLRRAYMEVFSNHASIIWESELFSDGKVDIDEFLEKKTDYPVELQKAIDGMETQFYSLTADYEPLSLKYENPEVREALQQNLHLDMDVYISLLMSRSNIYFGSYGEQLETILELDNQLLKTRESDPLVYEFDNHYSWVLYAMSGIGDVNGFYDQNFVVKEDVREKWKQIAAIGGNSPAALVMQEIIDEMEASNWKLSKEHDIYTEFFTRVDSKLKEARKRNE